MMARMATSPKPRPQTAAPDAREREDLLISRGGRPPATGSLRPEDTAGLNRRELEDLLISRGGTQPLHFNPGAPSADQ